jgi:hypothetical protein
MYGLQNVRYASIVLKRKQLASTPVHVCNENAANFLAMMFKNEHIENDAKFLARKSLNRMSEERNNTMKLMRFVRLTVHEKASFLLRRKPFQSCQTGAT